MEKAASSRLSLLSLSTLTLALALGRQRSRRSWLRHDIFMAVAIREDLANSSQCNRFAR